MTTTNDLANKFGREFQNSGTEWTYTQENNHFSVFMSGYYTVEELQCAIDDLREANKLYERNLYPKGFDVEGERREFEEYAKMDGLRMDRLDDGRGQYREAGLEDKWQGYLARSLRQFAKDNAEVKDES